MTASQVITFLLFAVVAAITPGPSNLILTSTGANVGLLRGLPCLGGVVIGMGLMMFLQESSPNLGQSSAKKK